MTPSSRYSGQDGGERPQRRASTRNAGLPLAPILALVFVIVGVIIAARFIASNKQEAAAPKPKVDSSSIYGDLPEELPPVRGERRSGLTDKAPEGLASNPLWTEVLRIAEEADVVFGKAKEAKAAGNHSKWNELGNEAKALYDKALEKSALWEEELQEMYGDTDRQVRDIMRTRTSWFQITAALHKTTGRG